MNFWEKTSFLILSVFILHIVSTFYYFNNLLLISYKLKIFIFIFLIFIFIFLVSFFRHYGFWYAIFNVFIFFIVIVFSLTFVCVINNYLGEDILIRIFDLLEIRRIWGWQDFNSEFNILCEKHNVVISYEARYLIIDKTYLESRTMKQFRNEFFGLIKELGHNEFKSSAYQIKKFDAWHKKYSKNVNREDNISEEE